MRRNRPRGFIMDNKTVSKDLRGKVGLRLFCNYPRIPISCFAEKDLISEVGLRLDEIQLINAGAFQPVEKDLISEVGLRQNQPVFECLTNPLCRNGPKEKGGIETHFKNIIPLNSS